MNPPVWLTNAFREFAARIVRETKLPPISLTTPTPTLRQSAAVPRPAPTRTITPIIPQYKPIYGPNDESPQDEIDRLLRLQDDAKIEAAPVFVGKGRGKGNATRVNTETARGVMGPGRTVIPAPPALTYSTPAFDPFQAAAEGITTAQVPADSSRTAPPETLRLESGDPFYWNKEVQMREHIQESPPITRPFKWLTYGLGWPLRLAMRLASGSAYAVRGFMGSPVAEKMLAAKGTTLAIDALINLWEHKSGWDEGGYPRIPIEMIPPDIMNMNLTPPAKQKMAWERLSPTISAEDIYKPSFMLQRGLDDLTYFKSLTPEQRAAQGVTDDMLESYKFDVAGEQAKEMDALATQFEYMKELTANEMGRNMVADRALDAAWGELVHLYEDMSYQWNPPVPTDKLEGGLNVLEQYFTAAHYRKVADDKFAAAFAAREAGEYEYAVTLAVEAIKADQLSNPIFNKYNAYSWEREPERYEAYIHDAALVTVQAGERMNLEQLERLKEYHASAGTEFLGTMILDPLNLIPGAAFEKMTASSLGKFAKAGRWGDDVLRDSRFSKFLRTDELYSYLTRTAVSSLATKIKSDWYDILIRWADKYSTRQEVVEGMDVFRSALRESSTTNDPTDVLRIFEHYKTLPGGGGLENISYEEFLKLRSHYNDISGPAAVARSKAAKELNAGLVEDAKYSLLREDGYIPDNEYSGMLERAMEAQEKVETEKVIRLHPEFMDITDDAVRATAIDNLVKKRLGSAWNNELAISQFADELSESLVDQHRIYKGSKLMDDTLGGMMVRAMKNRGWEVTPDLVERGMAFLWKARDTWVKAVLLTPRWVVNNLIDSTSRIFIYGANPIGGLQDVLFGISHQFTDELGHIPMEFAQSLARSNLGFEETVAARALYEGWTPSLFQNSFWRYEYKRLRDAKKVSQLQIMNYPPGLKGAMEQFWNGWKFDFAEGAANAKLGLQAIPGSVVDFNTYIEYALRLRLFHKEYFGIIKAMEPGFKSLSMKDVPDHLKPVADLIWRNAGGVPSKIRAMTDALTGKGGGRAVFNLLVPKEVETSIMAATAEDAQNFVAAISGQLQQIIQLAHKEGRNPTAKEFINYFDDFLEKYSRETEIIMDNNLALREATGNINPDKIVVNTPTQEGLKGAAPVAEGVSRHTEAVKRIKNRQDKIVRDLLTDFKDSVVSFGTVEPVPGNGISVIQTSKGLVFQIGDQVEQGENLKDVGKLLNKAIRDSLWFVNQEEINAYHKFVSQADFIDKLNIFINNPSKSFVDSANDAFFFSRQLSEHDDLRDVLEALHGKTIPYEDSNVLWEMWGREYDIMTETGAEALIARDHRFADDILPAPPEYAEMGHQMAEATRRLSNAILSKNVPSDLGRNITDFLSRRSQAMAGLKDYYTFVYPGPRSIPVGLHSISRQDMWNTWYGLAINEYRSLVTIQTDLAIKIETGNFSEVTGFIENWTGNTYQDFNFSFLNSVGVHPILGSDGITVLGVTFDLPNKKNYEPFSAKVKEGIQARFFVPKNGETINTFVSTRWRVREAVGQDAADALYRVLYKNISPKSPQADAWVRVITEQAVEWGKKAGRTPDEYLRRLGIVDGKITDRKAFISWAVSTTTDGVGRGFLYGMGGSDVPDMLRLSSEHYLRDLNTDGLWHKDAAREFRAVKNYLEAVTGEKIVNGQFTPEHVQAFAEAVFRERAKYTYRAGHLPPSLLRELKRPTGLQARIIKRAIEKMDKDGLKTEDLVLMLMDDGTLEIMFGIGKHGRSEFSNKQILEAIEAKAKQIPVTVIRESSGEIVTGKEAYNALVQQFAPLNSKKHFGMRDAVTNYKKWLAAIRRATEDSPAMEKGMAQDVIQFLDELVKQENLIPAKKSMVREIKLTAERLGIDDGERTLLRIINDFIRKDEAKTTVVIPPPSPTLKPPVPAYALVDDAAPIDIAWSEEVDLHSELTKSIRTRIIETYRAGVIAGVETETGLKIIDVGNTNIGEIAWSLESLSRQLRLETIPDDVKTVIIGHGEGEGVNWTFTKINKTIQQVVDENLPAGDKVWVISCETTNKKSFALLEGRVVESNGYTSPQEFKAILYRGISKATPVDYGWFGKGEYWTVWEETADGFAKNAPGGRVLSKEITLKNPYVVDDVAEYRKLVEDVEQKAYKSMYGPRGGLKRDHITRNQINELLSNTLTERLEAQGYDGVIINKITPEHRQSMVEYLDEELVAKKITQLEYDREISQLDRFQASTEVIVFHPEKATAEVQIPATGLSNLQDIKNPEVAYAALYDYARHNALEISKEAVDANVYFAWEVYKKVRGWTDGFSNDVLKTPDTFFNHALMRMGETEGELQQQYRFYLWQIEQFREKALTTSVGGLFAEFLNPAPLEAFLSDGQKQWRRVNDYAVSNYERMSNALEMWKRYMVDMANGNHVAIQPYLKSDIAALSAFADVATRQKAELVGTALHGGTVGGKEAKGAIYKVNKVMLDYQTRNNFDGIMKNIFPFWMFPSRSLPFWAETMMLHPELVAFYNKYKSASRTFRYQTGAMNSKGDAMPRLDGYIPIHFPGVKDPIWFNPLQPLSFRYVFAPVEQLEQLEVESRYNEQNMPPMTYIVRELDEASRVYGFSIAPWMFWITKAAFGIPDSVMSGFPLIPEINLMPRWVAVELVYLSRRRSQTFPGYENTTVGPPAIGGLPAIELYPEAPWHNQLVEKQLLLDAKARADQSNWSDDQKITYYRTVREAIAQKTDNPMWQEAYKKVTNSEAGRSWVSFFTGFYPKEFSTAEADMFKTRNEIYALQQAMNNDVMIALFDLPTDYTMRHQEYVEFLKTPDGFLNSMYSDLSVRSPDNEIVYEPAERSQIIADNTAQEVRNEEYYQAIAAAQVRRDDALFALPIGAPFEQTSPVWERYFKDVDFASGYYDPRFDFFGSNKPIERIMEDIVGEWYRMIYATRPGWNKDKGETYEEYQARYAEWETRLPQIANVAARSGPRTSSWSRNPGTMVNKIISNLKPEVGQIIPDEFWTSLYDGTNAASMEAWKKSNDTIFDALNGAWTELYWSPFWEAVKGKKSYERELAEQNFLAAHPQPPTDNEMYAWIRSEYGDQFSLEAVQTFSSGQTAYTVQNRLDYGITETEKLRDSIWDMLSWVAPGKARDLLQEQFVFAGGDRDTISSWYDHSGTLYTGSKTEVQQLTLMQAQIQQAIVAIKAVPPSRVLLIEYIQAQSEQALFKTNVTKELVPSEPGKDFWNIFNYYNELEYDEKKTYRKDNPENYKLIETYYLMRDAYAKVNPIWAKYYYTEKKGGSSGGSGGGYSSYYRSGGSSSGGGGGSSRKPQALSLYFRTAGGTAGLLAKYVASLPPSFAITVSPMAVQDMAAASLLGKPLPTTTTKYLTQVTESHPEWKGTIDAVTKSTP